MANVSYNTGYSASGPGPGGSRKSTLVDNTTDAGEDEDYWTLAECKEAYLDYLWLKREEINEQKMARRYRHGAQHTAEQVRILNLRKQPVVTYNRLGRKIDAIVGLMEKLKQDPKAYPLTPRGEEGAELATAVVRSIVQGKLREFVFPKVTENAATDGVGGIELMLVQGKDGQVNLGFARVQPDGFFYDPRSYEQDFSDARYMGFGKWLHIDDLKIMVPEIAGELDGMLSGGSELTTDSDREKKWFDHEKKWVRVVDLWYQHKGGWCWSLFTGSRKLLWGKSYFFDENKQPISKFIMFSSFVDHDGDRYGFFRNLKSSQDEINQRRSKGLHELVSRRIKAEDGAFADVEQARREAVRPDGVVIFQKGFEMEFDDAARVTNIEGQLKFLEDAKAEVENFGPNPALIGQGMEYKSGRAISLMQQAGIAELGPFVLGYKDWKLRVYRALWNAAQKYWTGEKWIRVAPFAPEQQDQATFLQINGVEQDEYGMPQRVNAISELDVDFILDEGPDEVNMMADAYDTLTALATQGAKVPPNILLELAPLTHSVKKRLLAELKQASEPTPIMQQAQQLELQNLMATVKETLSKVELNLAKAQSEAEGGKHSIAERMIDMQAKERDAAIKERQGQQKLEQGQQKMEIERVKGISNIQSEQAQADQRLRQGEQEHFVKLAQSGETHAQKLAQARATTREKGGNGAAKK